ncbi:hypothetical protein Pla8534_18380 [Lignipirellula cremea]|uniref:Uncharacterized protein n=1 Tax=Lignipirellula cremea TaxID=2528010 RepID=A0A518DQF5_9BACT|nr:hypothetical protein Pla8534_18380 [Lignipirellula cremea]
MMLSESPDYSRFLLLGHPSWIALVSHQREMLNDGRQMDD